MASDLNIHVVENDEIENHVKLFLQSDGWSGTIGHFRQEFLLRDKTDKSEKWVNARVVWCMSSEDYEQIEIINRLYIPLDFDVDLILNTPCVWVGEISDLTLPNTVSKINELINNDLPVLDFELGDNIYNAFRLKNNPLYKLTDKEKVMAFMLEHLNKKLFKII